jgi:glycine hydroxymethyltransferase
MDPSGIRIGAPALTTRGMGTHEFKTIATWIATALKSHDDATKLAQIREDVRQMTSHFPVPAAGLAVAV